MGSASKGPLPRGYYAVRYMSISPARPCPEQPEPSRLSLVVPVFNEAGNLLPLASKIHQLALPDLYEVIWVDNGSSDGSSHELIRIAKMYPRMTVLTLAKNLGYGGGILTGIQHSSPEATHIGWIPADGQVRAEDLFATWETTRQFPQAVHKGLRVERKDGASQKWVSWLYSKLAQLVLGIPVRDTNGLPKIFPADLLRKSALKFPHSTSFVLDAALLYEAHQSKLSIVEHPVGFDKRKHGKSSWSGERLRTYWVVLCGLLAIRYRGPARLGER